MLMCQKTGAHFKLGELGLSLLTVVQTRAENTGYEEELVIDNPSTNNYQYSGTGTIETFRNR